MAKNKHKVHKRSGLRPAPTAPMPRFNVGDQVQVLSNLDAPENGTVIQVSSWRRVSGTENDDYCYLVASEYLDQESWIGEQWLESPNPRPYLTPVPSPISPHPPLQGRENGEGRKRGI